MAQPTNTQFSVAVHLLTLLASSGPEPADSETLALSPATNPVHVRRILGRLRAAGLVDSRRGSHGGWTLSRPADEIDLGSVWSAINGEDPVLGVHHPAPACQVGQAVHSNLQALDRQILQALLAELGQTTVAELVARSAA